MPIRLTVIGGGPGGYTAAFAAARAGMSVTLVESGNLGGTCLNNGCIPTKTLKASADALELALRLSQFGITGQGAPAVDPAAVLARKEKVCSTLRGGLEKACASLGVRLLKGRGRLVHAGLVEASTAEGPVSVEGDRVILATGSGALELPGLPVDHTHILTSDDALALDRVPASIAIVGGGVIGCELAFIYQAFGSKVTVVEGQNRLLPLPSVDADMSALLQREMKKRRIGCELGRTLKDVRVEGGMVRAMLGASPFIKEPTPAQMKETPIEAETVLVTVGRAPNTAGLGLAEAGVAVDGRGWIRADEHMRTSPACMPWATRSGRPESCWPMSPPPRGCAPCAIALGMTGGWTIPPCRPASSRRPKSAAWGLPKRRLPRRAATCVRPRSRCANSARRRP